MKTKSVKDINKSFRNKIITIIVLFVLICVSLSFLLLFDFGNDIYKQDIESISDNNQSNIKDENLDEYEVLIETYKANKSINNDYVGQLFFDSKLIDLPVVQGNTNDKYMRTDWSTMKYDEGGSIFMEATNDLKNDQNLIIYGHNYEESYDPSLSQRFTPLRVLKEKENYEDNKIINFFIGDKLLQYQIVATFRVKIVEIDGVQYIDENEPIYVIRNYTDEEFNDYLSKIKERQYYDTGVTASNDDSLLTLQTCIDGQIDKYVVLAKLIKEIAVN